MFNNYASANSPLTNNPFVTDPTNAQARFPEISSPSPEPTNQYAAWAQQQPGEASYGAMGGGYQSPVPQIGGSMYQPPQQQQFNQGYMSPPPLQPQQTSFPGGMYGQQQPVSSLPTGMGMGNSYSYLLGQNQQQQPSNLQTNPSYANVAQFDPYASIGQGWEGSAGQGSGQSSSSSGVQSPAGGSAPSSTPVTTTMGLVNGSLHPREYVRTHKRELDSWDTYAWKQLISSFNALKDAWGARKSELEGKAREMLTQLQYGGGGYYGPQLSQEVERLRGLTKEAGDNQDSVAASAFQINEIFGSYRQSGDVASKGRVREAANAALRSIPDWPQPMLY